MTDEDSIRQEPTPDAVGLRLAGLEDQRQCDTGQRERGKYGGCGSVVLADVIQLAPVSGLVVQRREKEGGDHHEPEQREDHQEEQRESEETAPGSGRTVKQASASHYRSSSPRARACRLEFFGSLNDWRHSSFQNVPLSFLKYGQKSEDTDRG